LTKDRMIKLRDFASRYTAAWCSQDAASVAAFYSPRGSLTINGGTPSVGRVAITEAAQGFMAAFPDLMVYMDDLLEDGGRVIYKWTLERIMAPEAGARYPVCLAGERHCPPEDCGGIPGYEEFLEAIRDSNHPQHTEMLDWVGGRFDRDAFTPDAVNPALRRVR
jgi:hypothetical protein